MPRAEGERWRRFLKDRGLLRGDLGIQRSGEWILLPVCAPEGPPPAGAWVDSDFDPRPPTGPTSYRDLLNLPTTLARELPRSFDVVGDIVIIRLPELLRDRASEIGAALRDFVPGARLVGVDRGVQGPFRLREIAVVAGEGPLRTVHKENGIDIVVDLGRAYFSPRLAREHDRVSRAARPDERILDLCCGIGPFALTFAVRGPSLRITAVDLNPEAIA
ncbi:MAG: class I SAM-dependent methyltransferase, partial [Thermoplasmata archaeon]